MGELVENQQVTSCNSVSSNTIFCLIQQDKSFFLSHPTLYSVSSNSRSTEVLSHPTVVDSPHCKKTLFLSHPTVICFTAELFKRFSVDFAEFRLPVRHLKQKTSTGSAIILSHPALLTHRPVTLHSKIYRGASFSSDFMKCAGGGRINETVFRRGGSR